MLTAEEMVSETTDPDAEFVALLTEHQSALKLYVSSLLPGEPSAADVTQQANTTIWKKRSDFELGTNFKAWIFAIARFEVLNFRKTQARESRFVFSDELEQLITEELPKVSDDLDARQVALRSCLEKLRPMDRELISHRYFSGDTLQGYSDQVGRSVGSLKVTLHRIRTRLAKCVELNVAAAEKGGRA